MNKWLYLNLLVGPHIAMTSFVSAWSRGTIEHAGWYALVSCVLFVTMALLFVGHMWSALPSRARKTTPLASALTVLVPGLQVRWARQSWLGFADAFNRYCSQPGYEDVPLVTRWLLFATLCALPVPIISSVLISMSVLNVCNAVTALKEIDGDDARSDITPPPRVVLG